MTHPPSAAGPLLAFALLLGGCGSSAGYPSLAPRPIEGISLAEPSSPAASPAEASPEAVARYAPIIAKARAGDADFRSVLEAERRTALAGKDAEVGSESWIEAQQSYSRIVAVRAPVLAALSQLDEARDDPAVQTDSGAALAVSQAYDQVQAIDKAERQALQAIAPPTG